MAEPSIKGSVFKGVVDDLARLREQGRGLCAYLAETCPSVAGQILLPEGYLAEVYRARNVMVDRTVAIKLLHREHAENRHVVDRFLQEARAANFVRHPNVVEVLDIDTDESGAPFIVQEYLEGEDLGSRLEKSGATLPVQTAVRMLLPVIKAIGVAHDKGLVHRDLKPENIFLASQRGTTVPKVLDFGISKMPLQKGNSSLTITGTVLGSPAYMSPEQIQDSQSVDPRTDVWSLGIILYRTLTGKLPYSAESPAALFVKICTTDPEPSFPCGYPFAITLRRYARTLPRRPAARPERTSKSAPSHRPSARAVHGVSSVTVAPAIVFTITSERSMGASKPGFFSTFAGSCSAPQVLAPPRFSPKRGTSARVGTRAGVSRTTSS